jgi:8-oxo-dGTP pyrophosphatase MutT (NUDIX family)
MNTINNLIVDNNDSFLLNKKNLKNKHYCKNCGKYGHQYKKCKDPILSYGIICFRFFDKKSNSIINYNNINKIDVNKSDINIEYLLIQRKHTLGYIEFIRGKYFISDLFSIIILFKQMVQDEIDSIKNNSFDNHWESLWLHNYTNMYIYKTEFLNSKKKFLFLKENKKSNINLLYIIDNIKPKFNFKEWGFPKGRRNTNESEISCAIREFEEETSYNLKDFKMYNEINTYSEIFNGTNGIKYQHIYFIANCITNKIPSIGYTFVSNEIGDLRWVTFDEANKLIRPYHTQKTDILLNINNMLSSIIK